MNIKTARMQAQAADAANLLKMLSHPKRLLLLCAILERPLPVGELAARVGLRESSTSQQLAVLRAARLVIPIREGQVVRYYIDSAEAKEIIRILYRIFCKERA